jgi:hypothetical protein
MDSLRQLFWNDEDDRLRGLWRIALAFIVYFSLVQGIRLFLRTSIDDPSTLVDRFPVEVLRLLVLLLVLWIMAKYVDKRPFSDYGLKLKEKEFWIYVGFGVLLSAVLMSAVFAIQYGVGWISIVDTYVKSTDWWFPFAILLPLVNLIAVAVYVDLFFRGYLVINLGESFEFLNAKYLPNPQPGSMSKRKMLLNTIYHRLPALAAWIFATIFFLILRVSDGMITKVLIVNMLRASFLLTLPFILTRNLGLPIGLNFGWNFFADNVYGLSIVDLVTSKTSVLEILLTGPTTVTGGEAGPEGGLIGMGAIIVAGMIVMAVIQYRQKKMPPDFDPWLFDYKPVEQSR